jgi:trans-aconitate methyltransferase
VTNVFGEVAQLYEDARPGYPPEVAGAIAAYAGPVAHAVELGAGTGKFTEVLARLGAPLTCVEPDARMAAVLAAKFPQASVVVSTFEAWTPPPGGVPLLACALAWHWLEPTDPQRRNARAHGALSPGGTLAVYTNKYNLRDAHYEVLNRILGGLDEKPASWLLDEIVASGLWTDIHAQAFTRVIHLSTEQYLALHQTYSPFLMRPAGERERLLALMREAFDALGGAVPLELLGTLVLARRPA